MQTWDRNALNGSVGQAMRLATAERPVCEPPARAAPYGITPIPISQIGLVLIPHGVNRFFATHRAGAGVGLAASLNAATAARDTGVRIGSIGFAPVHRALHRVEHLDIRRLIEIAAAVRDRTRLEQGRAASRTTAREQNRQDEYAQPAKVTQRDRSLLPPRGKKMPTS